MFPSLAAGIAELRETCRAGAMRPGRRSESRQRSNGRHRPEHPDTPLQVLPDFRGADTRAPGTLKDSGAELARQKLAKSLRSRKSAGPKAKSKNIALKQRRLANTYSLLATDNALQGGIGVAGLVQFCADLPVGKLPLGSRRFFVPIHKLPQPWQATAEGRTCRSCVRDAAGATRLEVPWTEPRPSIHWTIDQGSIGWLAKVFLLTADSHKRLRGRLSMDPAHRRHNNVHLAMSKASVMWCRGEALCLQTLKVSPLWGDESRFGLARGCNSDVHDSGPLVGLLWVVLPRNNLPGSWRQPSRRLRVHGAQVVHVGLLRRGLGVQAAWHEQQGRQVVPGV